MKTNNINVSRSVIQISAANVTLLISVVTEWQLPLSVLSYYCKRKEKQHGTSLCRDSKTQSFSQNVTHVACSESTPIKAIEVAFP